MKNFPPFNPGLGLDSVARLRAETHCSEEVCHVSSAKPPAFTARPVRGTGLPTQKSEGGMGRALIRKLFINNLIIAILSRALAGRGVIELILQNRSEFDFRSSIAHPDDTSLMTMAECANFACFQLFQA